MKSRTEIEHKILKWGYIITLILVIIPFINHIFYDLRYEKHIPLSDLGDVIEVCIEALIIFSLGFFATKALSRAIKKNRELEEKHQKEKEEMNNKIIESVMEAQEKERKKISRELHDGIGQNLSILKMNIEMAHRKDKNKKSISKNMGPTMNLIDESIRELKKLSMDTRPNILDDHGLIPALKWYVKNCSPGTNANIKFKNNLNHRLIPIFETNIYRIVQEAVSNAIKHSKSNTINISLKVENGNLVLSIIDNGNGFNFEQYLKAKKHNNQIGIISIQERVKLMNGVFNLESQIGKGTNIEIKIPIPIKNGAENL
ncbi:MAG: sensor histidine kinase [bacterium]|nr:sensor histidine kinase [bacterium]